MAGVGVQRNETRIGTEKKFVKGGRVMNKAVKFGCIALFVVVLGYGVTGYAAISLPIGPVWAHMSDWTSLYRGGAPLPPGAPPMVGDEGRALVRMDSFYNADTGATYWLTDTEQMTALQYDFVVEGAVGSILYFEPGPRFGGKVDVYLDTATAFTSVPGPGAWIPGGPADAYPNSSDGILWLTGTYAPLFTDLNFNGVRDPGEPQFDIDGDGIPTVYEIAGYSPTGVGSGSAYIDITGGAYAANIQPGTFGVAPGYTYDVSLTVDLSPVKYGSPGLWATRSSDPIYFSVVPEPPALLLLGTGLLSLAYVSKRIARR
jgi:hypothetical protein